MFVQHFTIPGSNSSFNVSSIEKVVCWEMLWLYQFTTKRNDRNCTILPPKATTEGHHMEIIWFSQSSDLDRCQLFAAGHTHTM
jgi:hypothetical protein